MDLESLIDEQTFADSQDNNSRRSNSGSYSSSSGAIRSDRNQNELFTWRVKAGANRVYYLNIKTDKNGNHYLVIKETKHADDGSKDVHRVMIFEKDIAKFAHGIQKVLEYLEQQGVSTEYDEKADQQDFGNRDVSAKSESSSDTLTIEM
jgi:hypothetical protein